MTTLWLGHPKLSMGFRRWWVAAILVCSSIPTVAQSGLAGTFAALRGLITTLTLALFAALPAQAAWPEKPIRIVVPFVPGGAADSAARMLAPGLQKRLGQSVVIENRAGAGATIGTAAAAAAPPDGYTLLMGSASNAIGNAIQKNLAYVFERDLEPVLLVAEVPGVVVVPRSLPVIGYL